MFDNLRDSAFYEDEPEVTPEESEVRAAPVRRRRSSGRFLGMTAQQRFIVSLMVMFTVCIVGTLAMFVLGRMSFF